MKRIVLPLLCTSLIACTAAPITSPDDATKRQPANPVLTEAIQSALLDEWKAEAFYNEIIRTFGAQAPFTNIVRAERQHSAALMQLIDNYHLPVPSKPTEVPTVPDTVAEACTLGVTSEIANIALYDDLMPAVRAYSDVARVFSNLQAASKTRHLPAFERCAALK